MREENYFKVKLQTLKETLTFANSKLDHLDIQMKQLELRFEHDKKVYNDQTIHMQETVTSMKKRIPELEKKIEKGYTTIDMRTGKAYKSFDEKRKALLLDKVKKLEVQQKEVEQKRKETQSLKRKKRDRLSPKELDLIAAQEVREEAQPEDELKEVREKEKERLEAKAEFYRIELEKLKNPPKKVEEVKFDTVGNEVLKELLEELTPPEEIKKKEPIDLDELLEELTTPEEEITVPKDEKELEPLLQQKLREGKEEIEGLKKKDEHEGKEKCPECLHWYKRGGAFAAHYKSHFNGD